MDELLLEFWTWHYHANPVDEEFEDDDFDVAAIEAEIAAAAERPDDWEDVSGAKSGN